MSITSTDPRAEMWAKGLKDKMERYDWLAAEYARKAEYERVYEPDDKFHIISTPSSTVGVGIPDEVVVDTRGSLTIAPSYDTDINYLKTVVGALIGILTPAQRKKFAEQYTNLKGSK